MPLDKPIHASKLRWNKKHDKDYWNYLSGIQLVLSNGQKSPEYSKTEQFEEITSMESVKKIQGNSRLNPILTYDFYAQTITKKKSLFLVGMGEFLF